MILAIVLIVVVFLFIGLLFFTVYTESKDFYITFFIEDFNRTPISDFEIEIVELISQIRKYYTSGSGQTQRLRVNAQAVKTIYTMRVPSILYFKLVFRIPHVGQQYFEIQFKRKKKEVFLYDNEKSLILKKGKLFQIIDDKVSSTKNTSIYFDRIEVKDVDIYVYLSVNRNEESQ